MKNITVTVCDELYRHARHCAINRDTTLSELVRQFLASMQSQPIRRLPTVQNHPTTH